MTTHSSVMHPEFDIQMTRLAIKCIVLFAMLVGLPLLGIMAAGDPIATYLEFPPETLYVAHAPFSWTAFVLYALFIIAAVLPFAHRAFKTRSVTLLPKTAGGAWPWWGWIGVLTGVISWILAWTRFSWFTPLQRHTFTPLWLSYILIVNALTQRRTGRCMMCDNPRFFLWLFPVSAGFWWFFEYLNRFVQNWVYTATAYSPWEYFGYATLPFSTVLPAVLGTRDWLISFQRIEKGFSRFRRIRIPFPRVFTGAVLLLSAGGLYGIGILPNYLFPLLWISPLLIIVCLQAFSNEAHIFSDVANGDWRMIVSAATAALLCGFFWEMWNLLSLARWEYQVPFVHRFRIFEMPLLGYAGYLPFGLECAVIGELVEKATDRRSSPRG